MARGRGRPTVAIELAEEERVTLRRHVRRRTSSQQLALRSRIVLECADGAANQDVASKLGVTPHTVGKWRRRFAEMRLDGLHDGPRPGAPRTIGDDTVEAVIVRTLESTPKGATHWSTRQMAKAMGISHDSVSRIWRAFGLKPHRSETFQLSADPLFIEKVRDVVGLYMRPPDNAVVLCIDEKSQVQALDRTQPILPMQLGRTERRTPEYRRHGTTSLFAALDVATGNVIGRCFRQHRAVEFRKFLDLVANAVPAELDVHVIADNYSTHKAPAIKSWLARHPRFHIHFIPTHSSWLNQVERWFGLLTERQIKRGAHRSVPALERAIYQFLEAHDEDPQPFRWVKSADEILAKIKRFCDHTLRAQGQAD
jgi:transposase